MPTARRFTTALAVLFAASGTLAAQAATETPTTTDQQVPAVSAPVAAPAVEQPVSLAPYADNAAVGVRSLSPSAPKPYAPPPKEKVGSNVAMMIVGGAGLIVGAVVGGTPGTIIMIGGGVIGLVGLYRYLQ